MLPQGPTSPSLVQTLRWVARPLAFMEECREKYGDSFTLNFVGVGAPLVMISDPAAIRALYTDKAHHASASRNDVLESALGAHSLILLKGSEHLAHRRLILPPLHGDQMRAHETTVAKIAAADIDSWPVGKQFAVLPHMQSITLEAILRAVFGLEEGARLVELRREINRFMKTISSIPLAVFYQLTRRFRGRRQPRPRVEALRGRIDALLDAEIAERRAAGDLDKRDDMLSALMQARFEDGEPMSDAELRDELITLLLAGHDTTSTSLAWAFDLVLANPEVLESLRDSLDAGEEDYLRATVSEVLRLRPVVPIAPRNLGKDLVADGATLSAGTDVSPAIWLAHTRADLYPDPLAFRPERFLADAPDTYTWIPFGGGVRRCVGGAFAEFEMRVVLREVLRRCDLSKAKPLPEAVRYHNITIAPRRGTRIVVKTRRQARGRDFALA